MCHKVHIPPHRIWSLSLWTMVRQRWGFSFPLGNPYFSPRTEGVYFVLWGYWEISSNSYEERNGNINFSTIPLLNHGFLVSVLRIPIKSHWRISGQNKITTFNHTYSTDFCHYQLCTHHSPQGCVQLAFTRSEEQQEDLMVTMASWHCGSLL